MDSGSPNGCAVLTARASMSTSKGAMTLSQMRNWSMRPSKKSLKTPATWPRPTLKLPVAFHGVENGAVSASRPLTYSLIPPSGPPSTAGGASLSKTAARWVHVNVADGPSAMAYDEPVGASASCPFMLNVHRLNPVEWYSAKACVRLPCCDTTLRAELMLSP